MAELSRRAARSSRRGGLANVIFLAIAAEDLPSSLRGRARLVSVALPWGSLLRGLLEPEAGLTARLAALLAADGELELLLSASTRDGFGAELDERRATSLALSHAADGLTVIEVREARGEDVERLSGGWGRRLGIPGRRRAWLLRLRQAQAVRRSRVP